MPRKTIVIKEQPEFIESSSESSDSGSEYEHDEVYCKLLEHICETYDVKTFIADLVEYLELNCDPEEQVVKDINADFLELE